MRFPSPPPPPAAANLAEVVLQVKGPETVRSNKVHARFWKAAGQMELDNPPNIDGIVQLADLFVYENERSHTFHLWLANSVTDESVIWAAVPSDKLVESSKERIRHPTAADALLKFDLKTSKPSWITSNTHAKNAKILNASTIRASVQPGLRNLRSASAPPSSLVIVTP
ncbi:hypothetical protein CYLTODRAFT_68783 [Cylindrobasidium torrendii FP15055 ss-10]|uniref:Uncharacterized protein n=1 Tax=Cylindrobasidium torrendii FP15055 ss-10 TaxID=1314674 RepID=A0A0D7B504_9AGAR|nr:hypothetical protein CYLTODRAFT_68783 [Cylindrobasidium torrendii FP15055 ss-10]